MKERIKGLAEDPIIVWTLYAALCTKTNFRCWDVYAEGDLKIVLPMFRIASICEGSPMLSQGNK